MQVRVTEAVFCNTRLQSVVSVWCRIANERTDACHSRDRMPHKAPNRAEDAFDRQAERRRRRNPVGHLRSEPVSELTCGGNERLQLSGPLERYEQRPHYRKASWPMCKVTVHAGDKIRIRVLTETVQLMDEVCESG